MNIKNLFNTLLDFSYFSFKSSRSFKPLIVVIEPTYLCNLRCKSCNLWRNFEKANSKGTILTTSEYRNLFKELEKMGIFTLVISGGEPFLRRDILKIIASAKKYNLKLYITTNGTVLTRKAIKSLVRLQVDDIAFSLDSAFPGIHNFIRGRKGAFLKTVEAIDAIIKEKERNKTSRPRISINTVVSKYNIKSLSEICYKLEKIKIFRFYYPTNVSEDSLNEINRFFSQQIYSGQFYNLDVLPKKEELTSFLNDLKKIRKSILFKPPMFSKSLFHQCIFFWIATVISPYGDVYPCTLLDKFKIGNIRNESLEDIWNNNKYRRLRSSFIKNRFKVCEECSCGINIRDVINRSMFFLT